MGIKAMAILLLEITLAIISHGGLENDFNSRQKSLKVGSNDNLQNKNVVKSIQSEDGDIIDCIDIYKQPALNHPALRNHKIQMETNHIPMEDFTSKSEKSKTNKQRKGDIPNAVTTQLWQKSGSCPEGTVPIRRMPRKSTYEPRKPYAFVHSKQSNNSIGIQLLQKNHSLAIMHTEGYAYIGAKGVLDVWNPRVEFDDEYTIARVSLQSGPHDNFEAIESGWTVNPRIYKDRQTRLMVYWTVDGSRKTGCFDQFCPGFVQVSKDIALGAAIHPISNPNIQPTAFVEVYIFKDRNTGNWWLNYGGKTNVGYWPNKLFGLLSHHAETVQWGGEVYSTRIEIHPNHTATGMGSGAFTYNNPDTGSVKRMRILDNSLVLKFPEYAVIFSEEIDCYGAYLFRELAPDPEFYYGGPGRGPTCP